MTATPRDSARAGRGVVVSAGQGGQCDTSPTSARTADRCFYGTAPGDISVLEAHDLPMPIGMALYIGWDAAGRALWELVVHDDDVPSWWVVVDREFHPAP